MSLTMLGDLAVFWLYVTLICSFFITLHYIDCCLGFVLSLGCKTLYICFASANQIIGKQHRFL